MDEHTTRSSRNTFKRAYYIKLRELELWARRIKNTPGSTLHHDGFFKFTSQLPSKTTLTSFTHLSLNSISNPQNSWQDDFTIHQKICKLDLNLNVLLSVEPFLDGYRPIGRPLTTILRAANVSMLGHIHSQYTGHILLRQRRVASSHSNRFMSEIFKGGVKRSSLQTRSTARFQTFRRMTALSSTWMAGFFLPQTHRTDRRIFVLIHPMLIISLEQTTMPYSTSKLISSAQAGVARTLAFQLRSNSEPRNFPARFY